MTGKNRYKHKILQWFEIQMNVKSPGNKVILHTGNYSIM